MHSDRLEQKIQKWFDFPVPQPTVARNFIETKIEEYERKNQARGATINEKTAVNLWWLGGTPVLCSSGNANQKEYRWLYLMEEQSESTGSNADFENTIKILLSLRPEVTESERKTALEEISKNPAIIKKIKKLYGRGLVLLDF